MTDCRHPKTVEDFIRSTHPSKDSMCLSASDHHYFSNLQLFKLYSLKEQHNSGFRVIWWSIAIALTHNAATLGLPFLLFVRVFMGIGEVGHQAKISVSQESCSSICQHRRFNDVATLKPFWYIKHGKADAIQHLPLLEVLEIWYCKNLRTLPDWLKHLTTLQSLQISFNHHDLQERCKRNEGEDWHKISQIPKVYGV